MSEYKRPPFWKGLMIFVLYITVCGGLLYGFIHWSDAQLKPIKEFRQCIADGGDCGVIPG